MQPITITPGPLDPTEIRNIVREAETGMADGVNPKTLLVKAVLDHVASKAAIEIANAVILAQGTAQMLGDPMPATYDIPGVPQITLDGINQRGLPACAYSAAQVMVEALKPKLAAHSGRWLAKWGIVAEHVDGIVPASAKSAEEDALGLGDVTQAGAAVDTIIADAKATLATHGAPAIDLDFLLGTGPAPVASSPAGNPVVMPAPDAPAAGGEADIFEAYGLLREVMEIDMPVLADRAGLTKSTLANYLAGRTKKPKCDLKAARAMLAHIDVQIGKLQRAAAIFAQVQ